MKDRVDSGNIEVLYCPTEEMLVDFFTKCLQGSMFRKFRDAVMGYASINDLKSKTLNKSTDEQGFSKVKEHVDILKNTREVTLENADTKKGKNEASGKKKENSKNMNTSHDEISPLTIGPKNLSTVRSTVGQKPTVIGSRPTVNGPRSTAVGSRSKLENKNGNSGNSGHVETYADVLKYGKVSKNT